MPSSAETTTVLPQALTCWTLNGIWIHQPGHGACQLPLTIAPLWLFQELHFAARCAPCCPWNCLASFYLCLCSLTSLSSPWTLPHSLSLPHSQGLSKPCLSSGATESSHPHCCTFGSLLLEGIALWENQVAPRACSSEGTSFRRHKVQVLSSEKGWGCEVRSGILIPGLAKSLHFLIYKMVIASICKSQSFMRIRSSICIF